MVHDQKHFGVFGKGKWDKATKRYVPVGGGSRSKLDHAIKGLRPYRGFRGVDTTEKAKIDSIDSLYAKLDECLEKVTQGNAYLASREPSPQIPQSEVPEMEPEAPLTEVEPEAAIAEPILPEEQPQAELELQMGEAVQAEEPEQTPQRDILEYFEL